MVRRTETGKPSLVGVLPDDGQVERFLAGLRSELRSALPAWEKIGAMQPFGR
jgi:hypothetical protein